MGTNNTNTKEKIGENDGPSKMNSCCGAKAIHDHAVKQDNTSFCCCGETTVEKVGKKKVHILFRDSVVSSNICW